MSPIPNVIEGIIVGCDIHLYEEQYCKKEKKWKAVKAHTFVIEEDDFFEGNIPQMDPTYQGRDYDLFGVLAGVRREFSYSFEPRGLPEDVSQEVETISKHWDGDGHSHSWLTLEELKEKMAEIIIVGQGNSDRFAYQGLEILVNFIEGTDRKNTRVVFFFDN